MMKEDRAAESEEVEHGKVPQPHRRQQREQADMKGSVRNPDVQEPLRPQHPPGFPHSAERVSEVVQDIHEGHDIYRCIVQGTRRP